MRKAILGGVCLSMLVGCSAYRLPMNVQHVTAKTYVLSEEVEPEIFREKTFGNDLLLSVANTLNEGGPLEHAAKAQTPLDGSEPVADERQKSLYRHSPDYILRHWVNSKLAPVLQWKEDAANPFYTVSVRGTEWGIRHHPLRLQAYAIYYKASLSIRESAPVEGSRRGAWFNCQYKTDHIYDYDTVFADNAKVVAEAMKDAAKACIKQFDEQIAARILEDGKAS